MGGPFPPGQRGDALPDKPGFQIKVSARPGQRRSTRVLLIALASLLLLAVLTALLLFALRWIGRMFGYQGNDANLPVTLGLALLLLGLLAFLNRARFKRR